MHYGGFQCQFIQTHIMYRYWLSLQHYFTIFQTAAWNSRHENPAIIYLYISPLISTQYDMCPSPYDIIHRLKCISAQGNFNLFWLDLVMTFVAVFYYNIFMLSASLTCLIETMLFALVLLYHILYLIFSFSLSDSCQPFQRKCKISFTTGFMSWQLCLWR